MAKIDYLKDPIWGAHAVRHYVLLRLRDPAIRSRASKFFALMRPKKLASDRESREKTAKLSCDGFVFLDQPDFEDLLVRVRDALSERPCFDPYRLELGTFHVDDTPAISNTVNVTDPETIPEVVRIANDAAVLRIVSEYFGCKPIVNDIEAWWSLPGRETAQEAQNFHRDNDAIRFVKLFIYLTDVGDGDGPHVFVKGSHRSRKLLEEGVRLTDDEVAACHEPHEVKRFTGPFGTTFLEDTYGIHKGELPREHRRLILQVRYTLMPSLFVKKGSKKADSEGFDPYINHWIQAKK